MLILFFTGNNRSKWNKYRWSKQDCQLITPEIWYGSETYFVSLTRQKYNGILPCTSQIKAHLMALNFITFY